VSIRVLLESGWPCCFGLETPTLKLIVLNLCLLAQLWDAAHNVQLC